MPRRRRYDGATAELIMRLLASAALVTALGCASRPPGGRMTLDECQAAVLAEKDRATKAGRAPTPIVQRGQLLTDITTSDKPRISFDMAKDAPDNRLSMTARIFVREDGTVSDVQVDETSGVKGFDEAITSAMKSWKHLPKTVDCAPVTYDYPMKYDLRYQQ
jgi:TonB family protein